MLRLSFLPLSSLKLRIVVLLLAAIIPVSLIGGISYGKRAGARHDD